MGGKFHTLVDAVTQAMADTPRSSALVENLNSRLRTYFTLRRHLGGSYLDLLRFFLNHRRFLRSRHAERQGKSPRELMTGQGHPHWLTLLGLGPLQPQASLTQGGEPTPAPDTFPTESRPSQAGGFRASCVTQKGRIPNHAEDMIVPACLNGARPVAYHLALPLIAERLLAVARASRVSASWRPPLLEAVIPVPSLFEAS
jgi:hypothetical protein